MNEPTGPGEISIDDIGCYTIANTTLLDARKIMAYAAAINDTNSCYFDDLRPGGLNVHPAIAFSLQWNARFLIDREMNRRAAPFGVHAETDLRIFKPFRPGEAITTQGQIAGRRQVAPGVYTVDRYRMTNGQGELVAELDYCSIIRGGILAGDDLMVGENYEKPVCRNPSAEPLWQASIDIPLHASQQYTECANIYNPIHTEPSAALKAGLPGVILHGSATKAIALSQVINHCFDGDSTRITRLCGQLRAMVLLNTTMIVQCLAIEDACAERNVFFRVLNENGDTAIANGVVCGSRSTSS